MSGAPARTRGELAFAGLAGQAHLLARGEVSSVELVQRSLEAIAATQGTLNAFRCVREPAARAEAEQADRRLAAGERAPLLGVPVASRTMSTSPFAPAPLNPVLRREIHRLADVLAGLGHHVEDAELPYGVFGVGVLPRSVAGVSVWARRVPEPAALDPRTRHNARVGRLLGGPVLRAARALEAPMRWQMAHLFTRFDVVLTPTTAQPPLPVGAIDRLSDWETDKLTVASCPYTWPWNALGWPVVNVPAGLTDDGLPLGAQLLGPAASEPELISLAAALEDAERWHERRPPNTVGHQTHAIEGDPA